MKDWRGFIPQAEAGGSTVNQKSRRALAGRPYTAAAVLDGFWLEPFASGKPVSQGSNLGANHGPLGPRSHMLLSFQRPPRPRGGDSAARALSYLKSDR